MQPFIKNGNFVLINGWVYFFRKAKIGDVVVFKNPQNNKQLFCKRIAAVDNRSYVLRGDNQKDSLNPPQTIAENQILGRVIPLWPLFLLTLSRYGRMFRQ